MNSKGNSPENAELLAYIIIAYSSEMQVGWSIMSGPILQLTSSGFSHDIVYVNDGLKHIETTLSTV